MKKYKCKKCGKEILNDDGVRIVNGSGKIISIFCSDRCFNDQTEAEQIKKGIGT